MTNHVVLEVVVVDGNGAGAKRERVLTHLGFGHLSGVENRPFDNQQVLVGLDGGGFLNQNNPIPFLASEVFAFGDCGIIRVITPCGGPIISNMSFYPMPFDCDLVFCNPVPPSETLLRIDMVDGSVTINQPLGGLINPGGALWTQPWVDRWSQDHTRRFDASEEALQAFRAERNAERGISGGISVQVLVGDYDPNMLTGQLLGIYIQLAVGPPGPNNNVIFEREFSTS